jgi:hypothetical protein
MERAQTLVVATRLAQLDVSPDHRDDVGPLPDLTDDVLGNQSHAGGLR